MYLVRPPYLYRKYHSDAVWRMNAFTKTCFLTFDDGPIPGLTPWILDVLLEKNVKATFFCVGDNIRKYPEIFNRIVTEGHQVGNHTFNHLNGLKYSAEDYLNNVRNSEQWLSVKASSLRLFRPPYGLLKRSQMRLLLKEGYRVVMWDVLSGDFDPKTSPGKCFNNLRRKLRSGSIVVFHDNLKAAENLKYSLPKFIDYAKSKGYSFSGIKD